MQKELSNNAGEPILAGATNASAALNDYWLSIFPGRVY